MRPFSRALCAVLLAQVGCTTPSVAPHPAPEPQRIAELEGDIDFVTGDISPDGRYLSEIDWDSGDLRIVDLETGDAEGVTGRGYDAGGYAWTSAFSRDGRRLAVSWYLDSRNRHELRVMNRDGTDSRVLIPADDTLRYVDPVDWSPAGNQILVALRTENFVWRLGLVDVEDGSVRVLKTLSWLSPGGEQTYPNAYLAPDGRFAAYDYPADVEMHGRDIYALDLDSGRETVLVAGHGADRLLDWLPGGGILFYSDRSGAPSIWRLPVRGGRAAGEPELVRTDVPGLIPLGFTRRGYIFGREAESEQIHTGVIDPVVGRVLVTPRPVDDPPARSSLAGDWSPDGSRLAYVTRDPFPAATETLVIRSADGERLREITLPPAIHTSTGTLDWVEEDRIILFASERGNFGIHWLDPRDSTVGRLPVSGAGLETGSLKWVEVGAGGRIVYLFRPASDGGRASELLAIDANTGELRVVGRFDADHRTHAVSPDGEWLALITRDRDAGQSQLQVIPATGTGAARSLVRVPARPGLTTPVAWTPDGARIVYATRSETGARILWSVPADGGGEPLRIGGEDWCCMGHDLRFHPDGQRIAFPGGRPRAEVWVVRP